ncbi:DUF6962 family protein [Sinisalibacter lacisalsi]|uniref:Uncharacterized protein n=1 Tax=Sinisalibacter lacisalsi TaxID=1526570 RepID=A0ABQ1QNV3_9RHOB|nr:hypothetical protein [Sinisalibacter lacisalsi]GGD35618.1 hypothetical protein GCM10011358_19300 [Sinisalibacter lacisalsi]
MTERDTTLTDFALAALCAAFAATLLQASGAALLYAGLFAALGAAALFGALWHGWFAGRQQGAGGALWLAVMLAIGLANTALWLIAGRVLDQPGGLFAALAWGQFAVFAAVVLLGTRSFLLTSAFSLPPVLVLIAGHAMQPGAGHRLALAGFVLALVAAGLQARRVGLARFGLGHNALYHLLQALAFTLVFLSVPR